jgi:hypothetical protein
MINWGHTGEQWNDQVSQRLEHEYLNPLERTVINTCEAIDSMNENLVRAKRDCE